MSLLVPSRRALLRGLAGVVAAPAIVKADTLMKLRGVSMLPPDIRSITVPRLSKFGVLDYIVLVLPPGLYRRMQAEGRDMRGYVESRLISLDSVYALPESHPAVRP